MTSYTKEQQAEHRKQWTAALRSGDYTQGKFALKTREGNFCCLGVACELAVKEGVTKHVGSTCTCGTDGCNSGSGYENQHGNPVNSTLAENVMDWLGLATAGGELKDAVQYGQSPDGEPVVANSLAGLNDDAGWTFAQIADLIEAGGVQVQE